MEKKYKIAIIITVVVVFVAIFFGVKYKNANNQNIVDDDVINVEDTPETSVLTPLDFTPPTDNLVYVYVDFDDENKVKVKENKKEMIIFKHENAFQKKVIDEQSEYDEIYVLDEEQYTNIGKSTLNIRENMIATNNNQSIDFIENSISNNNEFVQDSGYVMLKAPIELNNSWQYNNTAVSEITNLNVNIELPFGNFSAVEVETNFENGAYKKDYFVKGIGLVKSVNSDPILGDSVVILESMDEGYLTSKAKLFNYNLATDVTEITYEDIKIEYDVDYKSILENLLKTAKNDEYVPLLTEESNATINFVVVERILNMATVDFSNNFLEKLNAGGSIENTIITNIANTAGNFYSVDNVKMLINGETYTDGHISFDEPFQVDRNN